MNADRFAAPAWLPDDVRIKHAELVESIRAKQLEPNPAQLVLLAQAQAQYDRVTKFLNENGQVLEIRNDKGELKANIIAPEVQLQLKLIDKIRSLLKDVGLDGTEAQEETEAAPRVQTRRSTDASEGGAGREPPPAEVPAGVARLRARLAQIAPTARPR